MFEVAERERIRRELVALAHDDDAVSGAALVGSAARRQEDAWSDIDLMLQLAPGADEPSVVERWTQHIEREHGLADSFDVVAAGGVRYRVLLLPSSLQIDVSFWPHGAFRGTGEAFRLLFGEPADPTPSPAPDRDSLIGRAWLSAIHARSALRRDRPLQATMMLDELRDQIVALQCIRHDLNPWHGRDVDLLPAPERDALHASRSASVTSRDLARSQRRLIELLLQEVALHDPRRATRLAPSLRIIASTSARDPVDGAGSTP